MATTKTTKAKTTAAKKEAPAVKKAEPVQEVKAVQPEVEQVPVADVPVVEPKAPVQEAAAPRKFEMTDMVPCQSVRNGVLQYIGKKTGDLYEWTDYGDITDVAYGDLMSIKANKSKFLFAPWMIILDKDAIAALKLEDLYSQFEEYMDVEAFLELPADEMKRKLSVAPQGFKDTVARTAALMVRDGSLDSVIKIKIIDDVLGKSLMSMLNNGGL